MNSSQILDEDNDIINEEEFNIPPTALDDTYVNVNKVLSEEDIIRNR